MLNSDSLRVYSAQSNNRIGTYFRSKEFDCTDGSPYTFVSTKLLSVLTLIRVKTNLPIYIMSGYRTPEYNSKIGGHIHSYHQAGMAADWTFGAKYNTVEELYLHIDDEYLHQTWLGGLGLYASRNFIHFDVQPRIDGKVKVWHG